MRSYRRRTACVFGRGDGRAAAHPGAAGSAVAGVDDLATPRAEDVAAFDLSRPLFTEPTVRGAIPPVVLRVDGSRLPVTEAETVTDRLRDEVGLAARFRALSAGRDRHRSLGGGIRPEQCESGGEIPRRGSPPVAPVKNGFSPRLMRCAPYRVPHVALVALSRW